MTKLLNLKIGVVGLGQIGGSLAKCLKLRSTCAMISGYDIKSELMEAALKNHIIDHAAKSLENLFNFSDIVILAVPMEQILEILTTYSEVLQNKALVTDTGSLKRDVIKLVEDIDLKNFVAGHPLSGTEKRGVESWDGNLFSGARYFIIKSSVSNSSADKLMNEFVSSLDSIPIAVKAEEHDLIFATTSNLPHLFAFSLKTMFNSITDTEIDKSNFICPSFYGSTRISKSDPEMVFQMLWYNRDNLRNSLEKLISKMYEAQEALNSGDKIKFRNIFASLEAERHK